MTYRANIFLAAISFLILIGGYAKVVFAAPSINQYSAISSEITVTGDAFGAAPKTIFWENFERGNNGGNLSSSPQIGRWELNSRPYATYSTRNKVSGNQSAYAWHNNSNQWSNFNITPLPDTDKLYQSFWFRYSAAGSGQAKLVQVHGDSGKGDFAPGIMTGGLSGSWWASYISTESGARDLATRVNYSPPSMNSWHHFEMILKRSSSGGAPDGIVIIKIDGKTAYEKRSVITRDSSSSNWKLVEFFTGMTNFGTNTETYIDDCFLNTSWSRVVIGNAAKFSECNKIQVQLPTSWSNSSIKFNLEKGIFNTGDTAYLYVVNENGEANLHGYPIKIGESAPAPVPKPAPSPPKNLIIVGR